jgi:hypothetical protein
MFGDFYSPDPMANYQSPMYGPMPDYTSPTTAYGIDPRAQMAGGLQSGWTPFGAQLLGDNAYSIWQSVANWLRMIRPL